MVRLGVITICLVFNIIQVAAVDYDVKLDYDGKLGYDAVCGNPKCEISGQVFPNCQDCSSFLQCSSAGGLKSRVPCPSGQYFDSQSKKCSTSNFNCPRPPAAQFPEIRAWGARHTSPFTSPPGVDEYPEFLAQMSYKGKPSAVIRYAPDVGEIGPDGKVLDKFFSEIVVKSDDKRMPALIKSPVFQKSYPYSRLQ